MAKNCNYQNTNTLKAQGKGRIAPSSFARNNLAQGGVNAKMGSSPQTAGTGKRK